MIVQEGQEQYLPLYGGLEDGLEDQVYEYQGDYSREGQLRTIPVTVWRA